MSAPPRVQPIVLCAGFGTRLTESIANDASQSFLHLLDVPKPLLPLGGSSIVQRWLEIFGTFTESEPIIITNALYYKAYEGLRARVHNDGATNNDNRLGAVADIELAMSLVEADVYVVVAGDTLLHKSVDVAELLRRFESTDCDALTLGYAMRNPAVECRSRGLLVRGADGMVSNFVEKPRVPPPEPVLASAPLYFFRRSAVNLLAQFLSDNRIAKAPIATYDAPGFFMQYLCKCARVALEEIPARIDIGSLEDYIQALQLMRGPERGHDEVVIGRCFPRVGVLGNPSDGYRGACVSFPVDFVDAAAPIEARVFVRTAVPGTITITPNRVRDRLKYPGGWSELTHKLQNEGFYGGIRLIQAAMIKFAAIMSSAKKELPAGIVVGYDSTIPFSVGLAGSSAIVTATMRALLSYYHLEPGMFGTDSQWAQWIMEAETHHLKIAAGLQDRVAQWFCKPMAMQFGGDAPVLEPLASPVVAQLLATQMFVVYSTKSEESGVVHSSLRSLYESQQDVRDAMAELATLPALLAGKDATFTRGQFCDAIDRNFDLRRRMLGPKGIGSVNVEMVELARSLRLAAKQAGSGGAVFCVPRDDITPARVEELRATFKNKSFVLCRVVPTLGLE